MAVSATPPKLWTRKLRAADGTKGYFPAIGDRFFSRGRRAWKTRTWALDYAKAVIARYKRLYVARQVLDKTACPWCKAWHMDDNCFRRRLWRAMPKQVKAWFHRRGLAERFPLWWAKP